MADDPNPVQSDSPEARRYNLIRRWLGIGDFVIGFVFLIVLLVTGWSNWLRDLAYRLGVQNYSLSLFIYLLLLLVIGKALGIGLDYYGFLLERRFKLSTQRFRSWAWDEVKGFLVGLVLGTVVVEVLYLTIRQWPQHWWMLAWALFMGLFIVLAQLAPVVLFPIFYKFEPLDNEDLRRRLVVLSERAWDAGARRVPLETFGKKQEGECGSYRTGRDPAHHSGRHIARQLHAGRDRSGAGPRTRAPRASPHS